MILKVYHSIRLLLLFFIAVNMFSIYYVMFCSMLITIFISHMLVTGIGHRMVCVCVCDFNIFILDREVVFIFSLSSVNFCAMFFVFLVFDYRVDKFVVCALVCVILL